jgi:hypothetical protein
MLLEVINSRKDDEIHATVPASSYEAEQLNIEIT